MPATRARRADRATGKLLRIRNISSSLLILAASAAVAGCGSQHADPALDRACGQPPRGIARPVMLDGLPTARMYVYVTARKRGRRTVVVGGYSPQTLADADVDWRTALAGGGHWKLTSDATRDGASRDLAFRQITFDPFSGVKYAGATGHVMLTQTCRNRTVATITFRS